MSATRTAAPAAASRPAMGAFERFLTVRVLPCIPAGVGLGQLAPGVFHAIGDAAVARVNLPVAGLIWLMVVPMLLKSDLGGLHRVGGHWRGILATVGPNWPVKPFSMALLGRLFAGWLFRPYLPEGQSNSYIAGLIPLAAAPCTAVVFVRSNLVDGEPHFTSSRVAPNDLIVVVAFAPVVGLLLGLSSLMVPWDTLLLSVVLYIVVPVVAAQARWSWARCDRRRGARWQGRTLAVMQVSGGSQSFNAVNTLRLLGRWMRMVAIPNQSSVPKAYEQFDDAGRMRPGPLYDRVADVMEELVRFTWLLRDRAGYLVDRYSERAAAVAGLPDAL